jgi:hypothetical protein
MLYSLVAQVTDASVSVDYLDLFADNDVTEDWEEGEDGREGGLAVDGPEGDVVGFDAVCEVTDAGYDFVPAVYEFLKG